MVSVVQYGMVWYGVYGIKLWYVRYGTVLYEWYGMVWEHPYHTKLNIKVLEKGQEIGLWQYDDVAYNREKNKTTIHFMSTLCM